MAFQIGHKPWNRGVKYNKAQRQKLNLSGLKLDRGFFKGKFNKNTYGNIHDWIRKTKGEAKKCKCCGRNDCRIEWANKDHSYKANEKDYIAMCCKCHRHYDYDNHLSNIGSRGGSIPNKMKGGQCVV